METHQAKEIENKNNNLKLKLQLIKAQFTKIT